MKVDTMTEMSIDEAAVEERRKYQREWRAKNKEKIKGYHETYWRKKARQLQEVEKHEDENA